MSKYLKLSVGKFLHVTCIPGYNYWYNEILMFYWYLELSLTITLSYYQSFEQLSSDDDDKPKYLSQSKYILQRDL